MKIPKKLKRLIKILEPDSYEVLIGVEPEDFYKYYVYLCYDSNSYIYTNHVTIEKLLDTMCRFDNIGFSISQADSW